MLSRLYSWTYTPLGQRIFDSVARRRYRQAYLWLMRTQWLSRDEIRALQLSQLGRVLEHAYEYSPFYRERLKAAGWQPGSAVDHELLRSLPTLERADLQERLEDVSTVARWQVKGITTSASGGTTTGQPVIVYSDPRSTDRKGAVYVRNYEWVGVKPGERVAGLSPIYALSRKQELWLRLKGRLALSLWNLNDAAFAAYVEQLRSFRPTVFLGPPSALITFANYLAATGQILGVPVILTTGESMYPDWIETIERQFGGRLFEAYGCMEMSHLAHSCAECGTMHVNDENAILEMEEGTSELIATDLTNLATPLIRYRLGDVGSISDNDAACGRGLGSLTSVEGRTAEVLRFAGGPGSGLLFPTILREFPSVRAYQVWQPSESRLQLLLQGNGDLPHEQVRQRLAGHLPSVAIEIIRVDAIPPTAAGKRPLIVAGKEYQGEGTRLE
jgi:phenylacetate-CoA ligase